MNCQIMLGRFYHHQFILVRSTSCCYSINSSIEVATELETYTCHMPSRADRYCPDTVMGKQIRHTEIDRAETLK